MARCAIAVLGVRDVVVAKAREGNLEAMFDHVGIAVSDLAASERFYRTVLSVLGVEPSYAAPTWSGGTTGGSARRTESTV